MINKLVVIFSGVCTAVLIYIAIIFSFLTYEYYKDQKYNPLQTTQVNQVYPKVKLKKIAQKKKIDLKLSIEKDLKILNKRKYSKTNTRRLVRSLYIGQRHYGIHYKDVLAMLKIESDFKIVTKSRNTDGTYDIGLSQQNSPYYKNRYKVASRVLKKYRIKHSNWDYDIYVNVLACYGELNCIKKRIKNRYSYKRWICSYNTGVAGYNYKIKARERYFKKFKIARSKLNTGYL